MRTLKLPTGRPLLLALSSVALSSCTLVYDDEDVEFELGDAAATDSDGEGSDSTDESDATDMEPRETDEEKDPSGTTDVGPDAGDDDPPVDAGASN